MKNFLACHGGLVREERWVPNEALEENCTNAPPIYSLVVAALPEDLWGDIVRRAHSRES